MNRKPTSDASPTPTASGIALRSADFSTMVEALDYAAGGESGFNYHDGQGELTVALPYRVLRDRARALARKLAPLGRGQRLALVADTHPDFAVMFYACQYAGLVPVPLPAAVHLGGREAYIRHLRQLLQDCDAAAAFSPPEFVGFLHEAAEGLTMAVAGTVDDFAALPEGEDPAPPSPDELAYLQYTSGSTRFPRGTMIPQSAVMANLQAIFVYGMPVGDDDRFCSWLPYYHDMGLIGFLLGSVATQRSVDFLPTRGFAMRPRSWLKVISRNRCTVSFSPPFGYTLCARRVRPSDLATLDLSAWRVAGVGAEMIHPQSLAQFAALLEPAGFRASSFLPCYGMAECTLAVSFSTLGQGAHCDIVDLDALSRDGKASLATASSAAPKAFIDCGRPLPGYEVEIRDTAGNALGERSCGRIFLRGASLMTGYFGNPDASREVLSADGWLDTGDLGYAAGGSLFITGRAKDLMIIKGRNIWPQDLEHLAEQQPQVRPTDASAFSIPGDDGDADGEEHAVLVVQCRETDPRELGALVDRLQHAIHAEFGIHCLIELVPPHVLPRTSSGKLSRSTARAQFLERRAEEAREGTVGAYVFEAASSRSRGAEVETAPALLTGS